MIILQTQLASCQTQGVNADNGQKTGNFNGKSVVVCASRAGTKGFVAGVGPGMFDGMFGGLALAVALFATAVATLAVGIATSALTPTLITAGISFSLTSLFFLFLAAKK